MLYYVVNGGMKTFSPLNDLLVTQTYIAHVTLYTTSQWHHNGHDGVSNHQPHNCLLNRLFRHRLKNSKSGLCEGNSPETGEFPEQRASKAENVSIWWRHHDLWNLTLSLFISPLTICLFSAPVFEPNGQYIILWSNHPRVWHVSVTIH